MNKPITTAVLLVAASSAFAVLISPFTSWDDLSKKSPDIVIARCTATPEPFVIMDGMLWADIEVITVLKGDTKPGIARMVSQYCPRQGERFLMFSTFQSNERYRAYNATESYRVVPLGGVFNTSELAGKPLEQQIQLVLRHRLKELNQGSKGSPDEKKRVEDTIKK